MVDAQLPRQMVQWLAGYGHEASHTLHLPARNSTPDHLVMVAADGEDRVVITKDNDFAESQTATGRPTRLLHVKTGNISNRALRAVIDSLLDRVVEAFDDGALSVRMTQAEIEVVRSARR